MTATSLHRDAGAFCCWARRRGRRSSRAMDRRSKTEKPTQRNASRTPGRRRRSPRSRDLAVAAASVAGTVALAQARRAARASPLRDAAGRPTWRTLATRRCATLTGGQIDRRRRSRRERHRRCSSARSRSGDDGRRPSACSGFQGGWSTWRPTALQLELVAAESRQSACKRFRPVRRAPTPLKSRDHASAVVVFIGWWR